MQLGDRIRIRRFLRPAITATIDYLSGESAAHPEFEAEGLIAFAIRSPSNRYIAWMRLPGQRLTRKFELLSRGISEKPIAPRDEVL
jgi:hypothetical protein